MRKVTLLARLVSVVLASGLAFGCAAPGGPSSATSAESNPCNPGLAAGIGALVGALVAGGNDRVRGAAIGAGLASLGCLAVNYQSKQVKSSQQVLKDYTAQSGMPAPVKAQVTKYETAFSPSAVAKAGQKLQLQSYIEVVPGSDNGKPIVEEELVFLDPAGKQITKSKKAANQGQGGGAYNTAFAFTLPEGVPQGQYSVKSAIYLDGVVVMNRSSNLQIVDFSSPNIKKVLAANF